MSRLNDKVYIIGAGFSFDLGYPLASGILVNVWDRLETSLRTRLEKVIRFHHPGFDPARESSFPDIEQLLTEISVNEEMFDSVRRVEGNFRKGELSEIRQALLFDIATWFHQLYGHAHAEPWVQSFGEQVVSEGAAVISFNWDLVLDHLLFSQELSKTNYGLGVVIRNKTRLLKPHGSLNWYEGPGIEKVTGDKRVQIFPAKGIFKEVQAFTYPRSIKSKKGNRYTPLIIPPTFFKNFSKPIFKTLWQRCTDLLSTAKEIYVLGYSLPPADLQAQYILRCGFHNQIEGRLINASGVSRRNKPTGAAQVHIINPDQAAARRIEAIAGRGVQCRWVPKRVSAWVHERA